jgi:hypothetical protein
MVWRLELGCRVGATVVPLFNDEHTNLWCYSVSSSPFQWADTYPTADEAKLVAEKVIRTVLTNAIARLGTVDVAPESATKTS